MKNEFSKEQSELNARWAKILKSDRGTVKFMKGTFILSPDPHNKDRFSMRKKFINSWGLAVLTAYWLTVQVDVTLWQYALIGLLTLLGLALASIISED